MNTYLTVDFGSTFTKLTAIDIDKCEIIATAKSPTTVEDDIVIGYNNALAKLFENMKVENFAFNHIAASSSAAGGLKMIVIGLVPTLTVEAAHKAALSSGAKVIKTFAFSLTDENVAEIFSLNADILIISGGTDGGNRECIISNIQKLKEAKINKPLIICGNNETVPEIEEILKDTDIDYHITANVMPVINKLNVNPVREKVRQVFIKNIVNAKGMENFQKDLAKIIFPTPAAVLNAAELLAKGTENEEGIGELMVIDVGGATTDVHSVADGLPNSNNIILKGMEEPYAKRTVEGDLGMRYSAMALYEATSLNKVRAYLGEKDNRVNIRESFLFREENPDYVANNDFDKKFDDVMAKLCCEIATNRHVGHLEYIFSPMGTLTNQCGKNLKDVKYIIATGGSIIHSQDPKFILDSTSFTGDDPSILKPLFPKFLLDKSYILAAMGILAQDYPDVALKILKKYLIEV